MHDFINSYMVSQEIEHQARQRRYDQLDADSLYQYEIWDAIGARPSLKERLISFVGRFRHAEASTETGTVSRKQPVTCTTQQVTQG